MAHAGMRCIDAQTTRITTRSTLQTSKSSSSNCRRSCFTSQLTSHAFIVVYLHVFKWSPVSKDRKQNGHHLMNPKPLIWWGCAAPMQFIRLFRSSQKLEYKPDEASIRMRRLMATPNTSSFLGLCEKRTRNSEIPKSGNACHARMYWIFASARERSFTLECARRMPFCTEPAPRLRTIRGALKSSTTMSLWKYSGKS